MSTQPVISMSSINPSAANGEYVPWSMRELESEQPTAAPGEEVTCIVCYETDTEKSDSWHHCKVCSAVWCDSCMASMYDTARDHDSEEVELCCPQCRSSIANMQRDARIGRIKAGVGCSDETAYVLLDYENLLTEVVHVAECAEGGMPYFTMPIEAVARVMARDTMCDVVDAIQGREAGTRLRRNMRSADMASCFAIGVEGYARVLRLEAGVPSTLPFLRTVQNDLAAMVVDHPPTAAGMPQRAAATRERLHGLLTAAERVLNAEEAKERAAAAAPAVEGRPPSRPASRAGNGGKKRKR